MTCWPPCNPWCDCVNDKCQRKPEALNAVRLRTIDGRFLTAVAGGGAALSANTGSPAQAATFLLVSRPTINPLTIPPPITLPLASGSPISLVVCDSTWGASPNLMRVQHSTFALPSAPKRGFDFWRWLFGGTKVTFYSYFFGGSGTLLEVRPPFSSGFAGYTSESDPLEWVFSIVKAGGGPINSGDQVSLRIDSGLIGQGPFFFRTPSSLNQALIGGDGMTPFQSDTAFVVDFFDVRAGLGPRPTTVACQICGPVTGTVRDAATNLPIANAKVETVGVFENATPPLGPPHPFSALTNAGGAFALKDAQGRDCVPPGNILLRATADRYQPKTTPPIPDPSAGGAVVQITLDCTQVRGRVIDTSANKNPIGGLWVDLTVANGTPFNQVMSGMFDGAFFFDCVPHGGAILSVAGTDTAITVPPEGIFVEIPLVRNCVDVVGTVTDGVTHLPLQGVKVTYLGSTVFDVTNAQGSYALHCVLPSGLQTLLATKTGYQTKLVVVSPFPMFGTATKDFELDPLVALSNTGVGATGTPLADGTIGDPHYSLFAVPGGTTTIRVRTSIGGYPIPPYIGNNTTSAWIGPNNNDQLDSPVGEYDYRTTFSLPGFVSPTVAINGKWSTDNNGVRILLNGVDTGIPATASDQFALGFMAFTITTGFLPNLNTLDFIVSNGNPGDPFAGGPTALRVEMTLVP